MFPGKVLIWTQTPVSHIVYPLRTMSFYGDTPCLLKKLEVGRCIMD